MRRWFISVFTLHFCISVVCFSIGHLHADEIQAQFAKVEAAQSDAPSLAGAFAEADEHGHGLIDGHVDAQEIIHAVAPLEFGQAVAVAHSFDQPLRRSPILAGLHRPPISRPFV